MSATAGSDFPLPLGTALSALLVPSPLAGEG